MQLVLLSGGSGKRLWPLSNDIRSKQFIKLFKNEKGEYESMVQKVYRQINKTIKAGVTVTTSKSQVSSIRNQIGEKVSVCIEPCRRDTFPAIALAVSYLHDELNLSENECIVVCPVDPYVDNSFFEKMMELEELVKKDSSNIVLMGIEPTYPSEKYGYIIPESSDEISKVIEFKEKPDIGMAKKYIENNALWNAGVFAFKLGYMLNKSHELIDFKDYRDLYKKYEHLEKISFDYAVLEKESSINVIRYVGKWVDVGTWNTMADVMADSVKGKAVLDSTTKNTKVVNELNIPIIGMGCKDLIIVASSDGILISDKEKSASIKPFVEKMESEVMFAEKSWGEYTVIDVQPTSMTIKVELLAGHKMSYHSHNHREEIWTVVSGKGETKVDGMKQIIQTGDVITIAAGCKHTVKAITDLTIIEVQLGENISASDKVKYKG